MKEYDFLEGNYNVGKIYKIGKVKGGFLTENKYILTDKGKFFLKKYRPEKVANIDEIEFAESFFHKKFPIILPIETKHAIKHVIQNGDLYVLYPFVENKEVKEKLNKKSSFNLGKFLAEMHKFAIENEYEYKDKKIKTENKIILKEKSLDGLLRIKNTLLNKKKKNNFDKIFQKGLELKINYVQEDIFNFSNYHPKDNYLIHGDYHFRNIFWKRDDIAYLFDTEKARISSLSFDIIRCLMYSCFQAKYSDSRFKLAKSFLNGYQSIRKLDKKEIEFQMKIFVKKDYYSNWMEKFKYEQGNKKLDALYTSALKGWKYLEKNEDSFVQKFSKML